MLDSTDLLSDNAPRKEVVDNTIRTVPATELSSLSLLKQNKNKNKKLTPAKEQPAVEKQSIHKDYAKEDERKKKKPRK